MIQTSENFRIRSGYDIQVICGSELEKQGRLIRTLFVIRIFEKCSFSVAENELNKLDFG
jgi:hypothetical protein